MAMQRRLGELQKECKRLGLTVESTGKKRVGKKEYVQVLQQYYLKTVYPKGAPKHLKFMIDLETPMLCFRFGEMDEQFQKDVWADTPDWYAEPKINGCRMLVIYSKKEGLHFYSRNVSVKDFLPVEYDNIWTPEFNTDVLDKEGVTSFIIDTEVLCPVTKVDTTVKLLSKGGVITETNLAATTSLLALNKDDSLMIQKNEGIQFDFHAFQILELNGADFGAMPYVQMRQVLEPLLDKIQKAGLHVKHVETINHDKKGFYDKLLARGGEGIVLKSASATYHPTESRYHKQWIKVKRTAAAQMSEAGFGDTIDGWIFGYLQGNEGTAFQELIGAIRVNLYLKKKDGTTVEHEIANCPNLELVLRKEMTIQDKDGKLVGMKKEYYNRVVEIDGQWISARERRLVHPRFIRFRDDKSPEACVMEESMMEKMII